MVHYGKRIVFALLAIALWATLPGCVNEFGEEGMPTGDEALVTISLSLPGAHMPDTRALTGTNENQVSEIDVLVFDSSTGYYVYSTHCDEITSVQGSDNTKVFTVKLRQGAFDLAIVANAGSILSGVTLTGKTKAEALALLTTSMPTGGKWITDSSDDSYRPIPMWGDIGKKTISESTDLTDTNAIALTRMVAKVDVTVDEEVDNFTLTSVRVYNYNTSGVVAPTTAAWDNDSKKVTAPTVPSGSQQSETPLVYDNANDKTEINTTANSCTSEIYLFEANNFSSGTTPKALTARTCLVVGGKYGNDSDTTYYRMDFSTESENTQTYLNVLRNHRYTFNITKVSAPGYSDAATAFGSAPINIEAGVLSWNEAGMNNVAFDGQYMLSVNQNSFTLPYEAINVTLADKSNVLYIQTDYPDGWSAIDADGNSFSSNWLTLSASSGNSGNKATITLTTSENAGNEREATVWIKAGRLRYAVRVIQKKKVLVWARSNIVWNGTKLTFAVTKADNATIPAISQGVFFKWGSLVAVSPVDDYSTSSSILFSPTGTTDYTWAAIPYIDNTDTDTRFTSSHTTAEDDFATYNSNTGYNATTGKGDICRYISDEKGWVSGSWRLPTADELKALYGTGMGNVAYGETPWENQIFAPVGSNSFGDHANGFWQPSTGRLLGEGATDSDTPANPAAGVFFPAGGNRNPNGAARNAGNYGFYWSGSSYNATDAYDLDVYSGGANTYNSYRQLGFPVRCVRSSD